MTAVSGSCRVDYPFRVNEILRKPSPLVMMLVRRQYRGRCRKWSPRPPDRVARADDDGGDDAELRHRFRRSAEAARSCGRDDSVSAERAPVMTYIHMRPGHVMPESFGRFFVPADVKRSGAGISNFLRRTSAMRRNAIMMMNG